MIEYLVIRVVPCVTCNGAGFVKRQLPNGQTVEQICKYCGGAGEKRSEVTLQEALEDVYGCQSH